MKLKKDISGSSFTTADPEAINVSTDQLPLDETAARMELALTFVDKDQSEVWNAPSVGFGANQSPQIKKKKAQEVSFDPAGSLDEAEAEGKVVLEEELSRQNLYKTELCRSFVETGICRYGHKCQFAHGQHEIRPVMRHPKYKTEVCKKFASTGHCPYGVRCRFIHPVVNNAPITQPASPATTNSSNSSANASQPPVVWSNSWATPAVAEQKKTVVLKKSMPAPIGPPSSSDAGHEPSSPTRRLAFFQSIA